MASELDTLILTMAWYIGEVNVRGIAQTTWDTFRQQPDFAEPSKDEALVITVNFADSEARLYHVPFDELEGVSVPAEQVLELQLRSTAEPHAFLVVPQFGEAVIVSGIQDRENGGE